MWEYVKFRRTLARLDQYAFVLFLALLWVLEVPHWVILMMGVFYFIRIVREAMTVTEMEDRMQVPRVALAAIN